MVGSGRCDADQADSPETPDVLPSALAPEPELPGAVRTECEVALGTSLDVDVELEEKYPVLEGI